MKTKQFFLPVLGLLCLTGMAMTSFSIESRQSIETTATAPPVKYQAVLRDERGYVRADETLNLSLELQQNGNTVYKEQHSVTADALGQVEVYLGKGTPLSGSYSGIDWSQNTEMKVSDGKNPLASIPVTAVPTSVYSYTSEKASSALQAISAQGLEGKVFDDEQEPAENNYYSSSKVQRLIEGGIGQGGQTALAKEVAMRQAEDLRLLDSLMAEAQGRMAEDRRLWDSLAALRRSEAENLGAFLDSLAAERKARSAADALETTARKSEDLRLWDSIFALNVAQEENLGALLDSLAAERQARSAADALETTARESEDLRLWDSIAKIADSEQNVCEANDHKRGIYTSPIPVYDVNAPTEKGLFTMPEMKILKQSSSCDLFSNLTAVNRLQQSYKTRVMVYNATGNISTPTSVMIPSSNDLVDVYVDNFQITSPEEYLTYDILVFDVEYYYIGTDRGKMYVTLVRE